jgi:hypothetical protein
LILLIHNQIVSAGGQAGDAKISIFVCRRLKGSARRRPAIDDLSADGLDDKPLQRLPVASRYSAKDRVWGGDIFNKTGDKSRLTGTALLKNPGLLAVR